MKAYTLILCFLFTGTFSHAQKVSEAKVPAAVKTRFFALYPNMKVDKWVKKAGNFEARFEKDKAQVCVVIDAGGALLNTRIVIEKSTLPGSIAEYVAKNYPGDKIRETIRITDAEGHINYRTEVGKSCLYFDSKGAFVRAEARK
ncbi:MAG TPA: PepSY-like domain-containing protein [Bacteroidia bacterium]|jgi:hypothetical protein|nr:PepSY-like domain-containing protein [Bacteroidia bacterium]